MFKTFTITAQLISTGIFQLECNGKVGNHKTCVNEYKILVIKWNFFGLMRN